MNSTPDPRRWRSHETTAAFIRASVRLVPPASGLGVALILHLVLTPSSGLAVFARWLAILGVSFVIAYGVDRAAQRLVPLATLLKLNLLFPDQAPRRWSVALRAGSTRSLEELVNEAERAGRSDDVTAAAKAILALGAALSTHDRATRGHSERVRALAEVLGEELGLTPDELDRLRWAAFLHDLGKLSVHGHILNKPEGLDDSEWHVVRQHPEEGARLAAPLAPFLGPWADTILEHHERWDGTGYPDGKSGTGISLGARIVGVADSFEVMTSKVRTYRPPISLEAAKQELVSESGAQFDPAVVRALLNASLGELRRAMGTTLWLAQLPFLALRSGGGGVVADVGVHAAAVPPVGATPTGTILPPTNAALPDGSAPSDHVASSPGWAERHQHVSAARHGVDRSDLVNDDDL